MEKKKNNSVTQDIPNIYDIKNKKKRKRHVVTGNGEYKSKDEIRRSHALSRKKRKKIIRMSLFLFLVIAIIFSIIIAFSQIFFRVNNVTVTYINKAVNSERYYSNDEIINASTIKKGKNLFFISSRSSSEKLQTQLPYISVATVKKDYPSGVIIEITECEKVYAYKSSVGYVLSDEEGKYLETVDEKTAKQYTTVIVDNITVASIGEQIVINDKSGESTQDKTSEILNYLNLVRKCGINITDANLTNMNDVYMEYDHRVDIHIGKISDEKNGVTAWEKLQLAKKSLEAEDKENPYVKGTLNMTIAKKAYFNQQNDLPPAEKIEN